MTVIIWSVLNDCCAQSQPVSRLHCRAASMINYDLCLYEINDFESLLNLMVGNDAAAVIPTLTLLKMATLEYQLNSNGFSTGERVRLLGFG